MRGRETFLFRIISCILGVLSLKSFLKGCQKRQQRVGVQAEYKAASRGWGWWMGMDRMDRRVGCPAQSHLPAKGEAAQEKAVGSGECVPVRVGRQQQVLDSHRCQEGQWARAKLEEEEAPGDVSQVRVVRTCMQMTPK